MGKILVVEDDSSLQEVIKYNLAKDGHEITQAFDGETALNMARQVKPDLVILDVMLPVMNGLDVCRILSAESRIPIIMLTARAEEIDKIIGLELGADDYITKPFSMRELTARIKALLRRAELRKNADEVPAEKQEILTAGDISIDLKRHVVTISGHNVEFKPKEFELLVLLVRNKGRVISREQILRNVWGYDYIGNERTVDVHMRWIRQKLETDPENPRYLVTVRGYGYKFTS